MEDIEIGDFSSWSVITRNVIIKHCDLSTFDNHGSALDVRTRSFWGVKNRQYPDRIELIFKYAGIDYPAHIVFDQQNRTRVFWNIDLQEQFRKQPHSENNYPDLRFERIGKDQYSLSFINIHTVERDEQEKDETTIEGYTSGIEGKRIMVYSAKYERNPKNRAAAIRIHGTKCMACGFDFEETYGEVGKDFIEVHHTKPLFRNNGEISVNPETDMVCLCSNCHRMIHRRKNCILTLEELQKIIRQQQIQ